MGYPEDRLLWEAIGRRDRAALTKALDRGADPNVRGHKTLMGRDTALCEAARVADDVAVQVLLSRGATQRAGRHQETPLIALVFDLGRHAAHPDRAQRCLELLLNRRPNLEAEGGDPTVSRGNVFTQVLRQVSSDQPAHALAREMLETLTCALEKRRKPPSEDFSASVLLAAFNFHTPEFFEKLVGMGLEVKTLSRYAGGLAYRLAKDWPRNPPSQDPARAEAWWQVLARHRVPQGAGGVGIDPDVDAWAQSEVARRQMDDALPAAPAPSPRPRI